MSSLNLDSLLKKKMPCDIPLMKQKKPLSQEDSTGKAEGLRSHHTARWPQVALCRAAG